MTLSPRSESALQRLRGLVALGEESDQARLRRLAKRLGLNPEEAISQALMAFEQQLDRDRARQAGPNQHTGRFELDFAEAFERLNRDGGSHNFVSLSWLRFALSGFERDTFDLGLLGLRRRGLYTLSPADGRFRLSQDEKQAGISEDGQLLTFVSRRT